MNTITINRIKYILLDEFFIKAPEYCKNIKSGRELIRKKKLVDFIFAKQEDKKWTITNGKNYKYDKILIKKSFLDTILKDIKNTNIIKDTNIVKDNIESAPDIFNLDDHEKFRDENNNIIDIETRGERVVDKIYFKVHDVAIGFEMNRVNEVLTNNQYNGYIENIHYKFFNCEIIDNETIKVKKELFLTYEGILRLLFVSHSTKVKKFIKWAVEILFIIQIGSIKEKEQVASTLLGVHSKTIKDVFDTNCSKTPCVYLYLIGKAVDLLEGEFDNDDLLCKFGCTDDLSRRCLEHDKLYKKEFNVQIELLCFSIIEAQYIFDAEKNIKQFLKSNMVEYKNMKEIIIINKKDIPSIKQHYSMIQNTYIGRYEEMYKKMTDLEKKNIELKNEILLNCKDIEIIKEKHKNDLQNKDIKVINEKHKNDLQSKDIEILHLKIKLLENQK